MGPNKLPCLPRLVSHRISLANIIASPELDVLVCSLQQLSAIELARNARIAANRAFMASVSASFTTTGSEKSNIDGGSLPVDHPLVLAAARQLARTAALEQARQQVHTMAHSYVQHIVVHNTFCEAKTFDSSENSITPVNP